MIDWNENISWLLEESSAIIRYRTAKELLGRRGEQLAKFQEELLASAEVEKWLERLGDAACHGSEDTHLENVLAKLVEYGFSNEIDVFDEKVSFYIENYFDDNGEDKRRFAFSIIPMLVRAGYWRERKIELAVKRELPLMINTAKDKRFDILLNDNEKEHIPKRWRNKPINRKEVYSPYIYSFYAAMQYAILTGTYLDDLRMVLDWILTPEIQSATGGYYYHEKRNYCYSGEKFCFPGFLGFDKEDFNPKRLFLLLELVAGMPNAKRIDWVKESVTHLENFRTPEGRYIFPSAYLPEGKGYYMYGGKHMGLGENRRKTNALEIESTFRMMRILKLLKIDEAI